MTDQQPSLTLEAVYQDLAEAIADWAATLGTDTTYRDPVLEESGENPWADTLRQSCDRALRTARTLLTAQGRTDQANDLQRRTTELFEAAEGYEQRLGALEDQRRVRIEGITAQYRAAFGAEDPDALGLRHLCQGIQRHWTLRMDDPAPQTPEAWAEAMDRAWFEEHGAKGRARAQMQRRARDLEEHLRLLADLECSSEEPAPPPSPPLPAQADVQSRAPVRDEGSDEECGGPTDDPFDHRVVNWLGKRLYLGPTDAQVRKLFLLLARRPGVAHPLGQVQEAVDGMQTHRDEHGEDQFQKSMKRIAKALSKLRAHLRENGLDDHIVIIKEGPRDDPSYTLLSRYGKR